VVISAAEVRSLCNVCGICIQEFLVFTRKLYDLLHENKNSQVVIVSPAVCSQLTCLVKLKN